MAAGVIAKGLFIKGELRGVEDLIVEGEVEGIVQMEKSITIERGGRIKADIETQTITIHGVMEGDLNAREKITIHNGANVVGDLVAPRIEIEDGAFYKGKITMGD